MSRGSRLAAAAAILLAGLLRADEPPKPPVARPARVFETAMIEIGHRYQELYWAGRDANWDYALFQAMRMRGAFQSALDAKPERASDMASFLMSVVPAMEDAAARKDAEAFKGRFAAMTSACNGCHEIAKMPFLLVRPPIARASAVGPPARRTPGNR